MNLEMVWIADGLGGNEDCRWVGRIYMYLGAWPIVVEIWIEII